MIPSDKELGERINLKMAELRAAMVEEFGPAPTLEQWIHGLMTIFSTHAVLLDIAFDLLDKGGVAAKAAASEWLESIKAELAAKKAARP